MLTLASRAQNYTQSRLPAMWWDYAFLPIAGRQGANVYNLAGYPHGVYNGGWSDGGILLNGSSDYALLGSLPGIGNLSGADSQLMVQRGVVVSTRFKITSYDRCCVFGTSQNAAISSSYSFKLTANQSHFNNQSNGHLYFSFLQGENVYGVQADFGQIITLNKWHTFVCSVKLNGDWGDLAFYLDGVRLSPTERRNDFSPYMGIKFSNFCIGALGLRDDTRTHFMSGEISYINIKREWVPDHQLRSVVLDPLLPFRLREVNPYWFAGGETPSGGFNAFASSRFKSRSFGSVLI